MNLREGAKKAAQAYHADMHFLNLRDYEAQQKDMQTLVQRELDAGCEGIVLQCGSSRVTEEILEQIPEMVSMSVTMSGSSSSIMGSSEESSISCVLVDKNERDRSTDEIVEEVRNSVKNIAGAEISVSSSSSMGSMMGGGVSVEIYGDDMDKLQEISDQIASQMEQVEGVRQVSSSLEDQDTEVALKIDKERARQYGLTGSDIASQVRNTVSGFTATTLKADGTVISMICLL